MVLKAETKVLKELVESRRTVHSFLATEVPRELINAAITASLWAPNHRMTHPWKFLVLTSEQRKLLSKACIDVKARKGPLTEVKQAALCKKFEDEGSLVLCCRKKTLQEEKIQVIEDRATLACSIYIMSLFLWAEGYASKWGTGAVIHSDQLFDSLGLSKECMEIVGLFYCGKPAGPLPVPPPRPSLSESLL